MVQSLRFHNTHNGTGSTILRSRMHDRGTCIMNNFSLSFACNEWDFINYINALFSLYIRHGTRRNTFNVYMHHRGNMCLAKVLKPMPIKMDVPAKRVPGSCCFPSFLLHLFRSAKRRMQHLSWKMHSYLRTRSRTPALRFRVESYSIRSYTLFFAKKYDVFLADVSDIFNVLNWLCKMQALLTKQLFEKQFKAILR